MPRKLIVFEGADGSGLSTQSKLLYKYLKKRGHAVVHTKEPTNGFIGRIIRNVLRRKRRLGAETLQLLFCADRANHIESLIKPALRKNRIVICDRYALSTIAYGALKLDRKWLITLNSKFVRPDLTILLDVPEKVCLKRIRKRGATELFEERERLKKIRANYKKLKRGFRNVVVVNGNRPIDAVFADVKKIVESKI